MISYRLRTAVLSLITVRYSEITVRWSRVTTPYCTPLLSCVSYHPILSSSLIFYTLCNKTVTLCEGGQVCDFKVMCMVCMYTVC